MGGVVGHLMHLYDNPDLTFGEIKSILRTASAGKLQRVTEKFDGLNLVFTWDPSTCELRVARAAGDIKRGGMSAEDLSAKFTGRGNLKEAFDTAFHILRGAIGVLPRKTAVSVFGESGDKWYSTEVVYTKNPNVINYDSNAVVFHGWPIFQLDEAGKVQPVEDRSGADLLASYVDKMSTAVANRQWQVRGPTIVRLGKMSNGSILSNVFAVLDEATRSAGLDDSATIGQYLSAKVADDVSQLGLPKRARAMVEGRVLGKPGAPSLNDIRKIIDKSQYETTSAFVKGSPVLLQGHIRPIELAINDFAVELLKGMKSTLQANNDDVSRLRKEVASAISAIEASGDASAMTVLQRQMEKLKSVDNITSSAEGVVFLYRENAYKFTGSFAAVGQILGLFKYGRGVTKI